MRLNDLIRRQEAINKILEYLIEYHGGAFREDDQRALIEVFKKMPTVDAVPVDMIKGRINDLKKMLMDIGEDELDAIWDLRTRIETLTELLEMWAERKDDGTD